MKVAARIVFRVSLELYSLTINIRLFFCMQAKVVTNVNVTCCKELQRYGKVKIMMMTARFDAISRIDGPSPPRTAQHSPALPPSGSVARARRSRLGLTRVL